MTAYDVMNEIINCSVLKENINGFLQDLNEDKPLDPIPFVKENLVNAIIKIGKYQDMMGEILRYTDVKWPEKKSTEEIAAEDT